MMAETVIDLRGMGPMNYNFNSNIFCFIGLVSIAAVILYYEVQLRDAKNEDNFRFHLDVTKVNVVLLPNEKKAFLLAQQHLKRPQKYFLYEKGVLDSGELRFVFYPLVILQGYEHMTLGLEQSFTGFGAYVVIDSLNNLVSCVQCD